jgi:hypothetical protein
MRPSVAGHSNAASGNRVPDPDAARLAVMADLALCPNAAKRRIKQLEIEQLALKKEKDPASRERLSYRFPSIDTINLQADEVP